MFCTLCIFSHRLRDKYHSLHVVLAIRGHLRKIQPEQRAHAHRAALGVSRRKRVQAVACRGFLFARDTRRKLGLPFGLALGHALGLALGWALGLACLWALEWASFSGCSPSGTPAGQAPLLGCSRKRPASHGPAEARAHQLIMEGYNWCHDKQAMTEREGACRASRMNHR